MQKILSYMRRAVEDYSMIEDGDRIAVGVSGGKDSITTMLALNELRRFYPKKFDIVAITLDMGFEGVDVSPLEDLCEQRSIQLIVRKTQLAEIIFDIRREKNPCSLCAKMRRGILHEEAIAAGCNKVALGHNFDDAIETFFLSLLYEGRLNSLSPVTYLDRRGIYMIRPLVYAPERDVKRVVRVMGLPVIHNPCPANGKTERQKVKELINSLGKDYKGLKQRVFHAMCSSGISGWKL